MLKRIPLRIHITPVLRELHWLKIHDIIIFNKAVNNTGPENLRDLIRFHVKGTTIRIRASFYHCLICVLPIIIYEYCSDTVECH